ncbi:MarR family winged helix-turn-helix transcriptional regulator [Curtobacterium sp. SGAir0471]|uniref:MarR family winged helix-turn-helix transcriptional regulator n=1 Tax=Curtobacterium sp. SGAir0471 TaxID=2070337 RepID=UPI0020C7AA42|nr:MarR family winged helix-turn-helix transcriptional regulator [Curtobacterium sp. SGAir0471]
MEAALSEHPGHVLHPLQRCHPGRRQRELLVQQRVRDLGLEATALTDQADPAPLGSGLDRGGAAGTVTQPVDDKIAEIEYAQMLLARHSQAQHRKEGSLERSAYLLLSRINAQGPMTIGELSEAFGLDASTLQRQTTAAVKAGVLERIPNPDGGMARRFRLTDHGSSELEEARRRFVDALGTVLSEWDPDDLDAFAGYLKRFNADIERTGGRSWPHP